MKSRQERSGRGEGKRRRMSSRPRSLTFATAAEEPYKRKEPVAIRDPWAEAPPFSAAKTTTLSDKRCGEGH